MVGVSALVGQSSLIVLMSAFVEVDNFGLVLLKQGQQVLSDFEVFSEWITTGRICKTVDVELNERFSCRSFGVGLQKFQIS